MLHKNFIIMQNITTLLSYLRPTIPGFKVKLKPDIMKKLFASLLIIFGGYTTINAQSCDHTFTMIDSYGDGWNGSTVDITVNGAAVVTGATAAFVANGGGSTEDLLFSASSGDVIALANWTTGSWTTEVSWEIKDGDGVVVASGVHGGTPSVNGYCAPPPPCDHTFTMIDSYGDGWNGSTVDITVNGAAVVTGATAAFVANGGGSTEDLLFSASSGDVIALANWTTGSWTTEVSWEIKDGDGVVIASGLHGGLPTVSGACSSCAAPSALTATNITATSADLGWTDIAAAGLSNVEYGTGGFVLGSGTQISGTTNNPESITGLTPTTAYEFYVQSDCGSGQSVWAGPFSFTTLCAVITPNYLQAFATFVPDACWSEATAGTVATGPSSFGLGNWSAGTAIGNTVRVNLYFNNVNDWVLSPNFDLSLGGYEVAPEDFALTEFVCVSKHVITVAYSEDGITWTALMSWSAADALPNTLTPFSALIPSLGSNVQFGILASDGTVNDLEDYDFHFDNFEVRLPPSCPIIADFVVDTNSTCVGSSISFTDSSAGNAISWNWNFDNRNNQQS